MVSGIMQLMQRLHGSRGLVRNLCDLARNLCENLGCMKLPCFNVQGCKPGRFCSKHKEESMVDVKHAKCQHPTCMKQPYFNVPGSKADKICSGHKEESMANVKDRTFAQPGCMKLPAMLAGSARSTKRRTWSPSRAISVSTLAA